MPIYRPWLDAALCGALSGPLHRHEPGATRHGATLYRDAPCPVTPGGSEQQDGPFDTGCTYTNFSLLPATATAAAET